jgi:predicted negative regulator of RcsB-dependent stress response
MARRITRKQIKHDEFVEGVDRAAHWVEENARTVVLAVVGVVIVAAAILGLRFWRASGQADAAMTLARGQAALQGAVVSPEQARPDDILTPTFASDAERLASALDSFRDAAGATWSSAKPVARLYEAIALERSGDRSGARALLGEILPDVAEPRSLAALAAGYAAQLALEDADWGAAEAGYRELMDRHPAYPDALARLGLARSLAGAGRVDEARRMLRDIERAEAGTGLAEIARVHRETLP